MDKLKGGVSNVSSTVVGGASGLSHTVKGGFSGLGAHMKDSVDHVTDFGTSVKDTMMNRKKDYDYADELIEHYQLDLNTSIKGLKFLQLQINLIGTKHWPNFFTVNLAICDLYIRLIGQDALHFKGVEKYYQEFSVWQSEQIIPHIHPKDRQFLILSINNELWSYKSTLEQLRNGVLEEWKGFSVETKQKIKSMSSHLKNSLKLIRLRTKKKREKEIIEGKISKLLQKTSPLDEKEQAKMAKLEAKLKLTMPIYTAVDSKTKTLLPYVMTYFEEFLDNVTKLIICEQNRIYNEVFLALNYYSTFHGLLAEKNGDRVTKSTIGLENGQFKDQNDSVISSDLDRNELKTDENTLVDHYKDDGVISLIISSWEQATEPIRLEIETSITMIANRNPELVDKELDPTVHDPLKVSKLWSKASHSLDKKNPVKVKDHVNGMFDEHQVVDELVSFEKYNNHQMNQNETYNPSKMLDIDDVIVPHSMVVPITITPDEEIKQPAICPPALPPRANAPKHYPPLSPHALALPRSSLANGIFSPQMHHDPSLDSLSDEDDINDNVDKTMDINVNAYDDDDSSILSDSSQQTSISLSSTGFKTGQDDITSKNLSRIYNGDKNKILQAPVLPQKIDTSVDTHMDSTLFQPVTSISYRLAKFNRFFSHVSQNIDNAPQATAVYDYDGMQPGDLRFKKDDNIYILYSFPRGSIAEGWYIGSTGESGRTGFVPGNYLEF